MQSEHYKRNVCSLVCCISYVLNGTILGVAHGGVEREGATEVTILSDFRTKLAVTYCNGTHLLCSCELATMFIGKI
jgi:hypothetical protein